MPSRAMFVQIQVVRPHFTGLFVVSLLGWRESAHQRTPWQRIEVRRGRPKFGSDLAEHRCSRQYLTPPSRLLASNGAAGANLRPNPSLARPDPPELSPLLRTSGPHSKFPRVGPSDVTCNIVGGTSVNVLNFTRLEPNVVWLGPFWGRFRSNCARFRPSGIRQLFAIGPLFRNVGLFFADSATRGRFLPNSVQCRPVFGRTRSDLGEFGRSWSSFQVMGDRRRPSFRSNLARLHQVLMLEMSAQLYGSKSRHWTWTVRVDTGAAGPKVIGTLLRERRFSPDSAKLGGFGPSFGRDGQFWPRL